MTNVTLPPETEPGDPRGNRMQGWLQSDKQSHEAMWKLNLRSPMAVTVLHFMISKLTRGASGVVISAGAMARQMGISERSAKAAVAILRETKFVQVLKSGNTNAYIVNSRVAWQGIRGQRHASFNAQIVVDEKEQETTVEELIEQGAQLLDVPVMSFAPMDTDDGIIEAEDGKTDANQLQLDMGGGK